METSGADDGTDFRPFFDMVVGILLVLLILVATQICFQQTQIDAVASSGAKREAALRRADISAFLNALAGRLRADGLAATADADVVLLSLYEVLDVSTSVLPAVNAAPADRLAATLAELTGCVTAPRSASPACSPFERLGLDGLSIMVRVSGLPPGATLPRDRFSDLGSTLLSARVFGGARRWSPHPTRRADG